MLYQKNLVFLAQNSVRKEKLLLLHNVKGESISCVEFLIQWKETSLFRCSAEKKCFENTLKRNKRERERSNTERRKKNRRNDEVKKGNIIIKKKALKKFSLANLIPFFFIFPAWVFFDFTKAFDTTSHVYTHDLVDLKLFSFSRFFFSFCFYFHSVLLLPFSFAFPVGTS